MSIYRRNTAIPNQQITLQTLFRKFGLVFDPADWGPVLITKKDPRDPTYSAGTDLLETIPKANVTHVSTGVFEYTTLVTTTQLVGEYFDVFTFKFELGGEDFLLVNDFEVTVAGLPQIGYVTVAEIREEGLTDEVKYPSSFLNRRIAFASRMIEKYTGRWFEAREMILDLDGYGTWQMQLDFPIVSVETITLLDREFPPTEVFTFELDDLVVYNRHITMGLVAPDDREDPRIGNVYFPKGRQNVRVQGSFGYTDSNGETPEEIKRATILMVLRDKEMLAAPKRKSSLLVGISGPLLEEKTDDHSYKLGGATWSVGSNAYFTGDPEIDQLLLNFRRPMGLGKGLGANLSSRDLDGNFDRFNAGYDFFFGRSI